MSNHVWPTIFSKSLGYEMIYNPTRTDTRRRGVLWLNDLKRLCTACGSEQLAGPYVTKSHVWYGVFSYIRSGAFVCLDCGHIEHYCSKEGFDIIRRKAEKNQENEIRKSTKLCS